MELSSKENNVLKYFDEKNISIPLDVLSELEKYVTARINIRNSGNAKNNVKVVTVSDINSKIDYPDWFQDSRGSGLIIHSSSCILDIKLECINDGELSILLLGMGFTDKLGTRFPIFIDFTSFQINGEEILENPVVAWHDEPYRFNRFVNDSETINIHIEWKPFDNTSIFKTKFLDQQKQIDILKKKLHRKEKRNSYNSNQEDLFNEIPIESRVIDENIFNSMLKNDIYFKGRWEYMEEIINEVKKFKDVKKILEFGPYKLPLVKGEDVIDRTTQFINYFPIKVNNVIEHDCSIVPYPIEDKEYDLVIACQALEHFGIFGQQVKIFDELERISHKAIISLPYKWFTPKMRDHHMIDEKVIEIWASGRKPSFEKITAERILQVYEFE